VASKKWEGNDGNFLTEPSLARQTAAKQSQRNEGNEEARDERAFLFLGNAMFLTRFFLWQFFY
jgi:hypothetical protein